MEKFNLDAAIQRTLFLLEESGASKKLLKEYRCTGLGRIKRHFYRRGIYDVDADMLDKFLADANLQRKDGEISTYTWRLVRRGCALLKLCVTSDTIVLPALRPWNIELGKPKQSLLLDKPTPKQLENPRNVFALAWRIREALRNSGLSSATLKHYTCEGLAVIVRKHDEVGTELYSDHLVRQMVAAKRSQYEQGATDRGSYQNLRKAAYLMDKMYETGKFVLDYVPAWELREPSAEFGRLVNDFCGYASRNGLLAESTIGSVKSAVRQFIFALEDAGITSFEGISLNDISTVATNMSRKYKGGLRSAIFGVRVFLTYLSNTDVTEFDMGFALPEMVAHRKSFHEGFSENEISLLLNAPDTKTAIGKRDYAMMLLASRTGLRACDVVRLKRSDIDWRNREIRIIQHKTGKALALPLESECGNAIADYILNGRPQSKLPQIFLCHDGLVRPIASRSASGMVTRYMKRAGIENTTSRRAFHGFRKAVGTGLLQKEIPVDMIQEILGHANLDSAKPYLSVDEQGLKMCALSLKFRDCEGDGL